MEYPKIKILEGPYGFFTAIDGARKSFDSEAKSDSYQSGECRFGAGDGEIDQFIIGDKDLALMKRLILNGDSHAKGMRMVVVWLQITAPRYWWQEFDTYRIGVEKQSQSTMHTILKRKLTQEDFIEPIYANWLWQLNDLVEKRLFVELKRFLPEGFLQTRNVKVNYQALRHIYFDRRNHKLQEWKNFCNWICKELPYYQLIIAEKKDD